MNVISVGLPDTARKLVDRPWRLLIDGEMVTTATTFGRRSPVTGTIIAQVPDATSADVDRAVTAAHRVRGAWAATPPLARADAVRALADLVEAHGEELALLDTSDAGSPISNSRFDVTLALSAMRRVAGQALELKGLTVPGPGALHAVVREPVGVVARIVPWNHPLMFAATVATPLIAGNPVVLKPPEAAPLSALRLGELARDVFPPGVLSVLVGDGPAVPDALVRHHLVRRIGFIGSGSTGLAIQRAAAETGVKEVSLELGGKNAMLVFGDADLDAAAAGVVDGMNFTWSGQSCGSTSRLLVHRSIHDDLVTRLVAIIEARLIGDPFDPASQQGTLIHAAHRDRVLAYIDGAVSDGAKVVTGGGPVSVPAAPAGLFVAPTVLTDVDPTSRLGQQEVFGPVLSVMAFDHEDQAVGIANDVAYGLTAAVWTRDIDRALRLADKLEVGFVWVNGSAAHYPNVPYGGVKGSGFGREDSLEELLSYTSLKAINVMRGTGAR